jgi:hypothetical protein
MYFGGTIKQAGARNRANNKKVAPNQARPKIVQQVIDSAHDLLVAGCRTKPSADFRDLFFDDQATRRIGPSKNVAKYSVRSVGGC